MGTDMSIFFTINLIMVPLWWLLLCMCNWWPRNGNKDDIEIEDADDLKDLNLNTALNNSSVSDGEKKTNHMH